MFLVVVRLCNERLWQWPGVKHAMAAFSVPIEVIESSLVELHTDPHKRVVEMLFLKQEQRFRLRAEDVDRLKLDDFYQINIIDELRIVGDGSVEEIRDALAFVLFDRDSASEVSEPAFLQKLDQTEADVLAQRKILLELIPVAGARGYLLAGTVKWIDR